jgi:hypothetical protein
MAITSTKGGGGTATCGFSQLLNHKLMPPISPQAYEDEVKQSIRRSF